MAEFISSINNPSISFRTNLGINFLSWIYKYVLIYGICPIIIINMHKDVRKNALSYEMIVWSLYGSSVAVSKSICANEHANYWAV